MAAAGASKTAYVKDATCERAASPCFVETANVCVQLARLLQDSTRRSCIARLGIPAPCDGRAFAQLHDWLVLQRRRAIGGFLAFAGGAVGLNNLHLPLNDRF